MKIKQSDKIGIICYMKCFATQSGCQFLLLIFGTFSAGLHTCHLHVINQLRV